MSLFAIGLEHMATQWLTIRQSIPSSNIDNCAAVTLTLPSFAAGQTKRPFFNRLLNRHAPWGSARSCLKLSPGQFATFGEPARTPTR